MGAVIVFNFYWPSKHIREHSIILIGALSMLTFRRQLNCLCVVSFSNATKLSRTLFQGKATEIFCLESDFCSIGHKLRAPVVRVESSLIPRHDFTFMWRTFWFVLSFFRLLASSCLEPIILDVKASSRAESLLSVYDNFKHFWKPNKNMYDSVKLIDSDEENMY